MTEATSQGEVTSRLLEEDNKLMAERRAKLAARREKGNAFPNTFRRDAYAGDLQRELADKSKEELEVLGRRAKVAGRILRMRGPFIVIQDVSGQIQLYVDKKGLSTELADDIKTWDLGDLVAAEGVVHLSGKGDLYVYIEQCQLLTKSLRPLPDKFHGLADQEMRYRQRYVDLIVNPESRSRFEVRSRIISGIRRFMEQQNFMEVETPMLQTIPGGATARPFITHHNALDQDMYLRIAPELFLKRLVVGGFEKVYEINRNFRNEGLSTRHNPEFTMIEFYWAYADYNDLMDFTEALLKTLAEDVLGQTQVPYQGEVYEFGQPFQRLTMKEAVLKYGEGIQVSDLETREAAAAVAQRLKIEVKPIWGLGRIITEIFEAVAEHQLRQPTFITEYPAEVSPLARRNDSNPDVTDRFEFFIGGREIANGFSELNDPEDQRDRFLEQVAEKEAGDDEAMFFDADYIRALEYGLPPTAGEGIGIDRLVMLFTDSPSIRDVLLFPAMRPEAE
ncbi:lysine--tRNA ligase [Marinospirillum alkaliphilum]|uniref:Lysine--tRNA ligase n=1 Tax=Marinospirillum alkaliphilum DSM 21637 TaxID=1122209 RepID=A0A1K1V6B1_9GAMM|nr:lysine--tRNA ligase [Marinospirillum alkaliphilum]SFX20267.1 lysyl-tRNA synthetase, class II [Marinospirillum alkaliphilum DSM 21637]